MESKSDIFYDYIARNNIDKLKEIINTDTLNKYNLLHVAVMYNNINICKLLIKLNVDVNKIDHLNNVPLYYAITNNNMQIIRLLLIHNAKLDLCKHLNRYLIHITYNNYIEMLKLLIKHNVDINLKYKKKTVLDWAVKLDNKDIIKLLKN